MTNGKWQVAQQIDDHGFQNTGKDNHGTSNGVHDKTNSTHNKEDLSKDHPLNCTEVGSFCHDQHCPGTLVDLEVGSEGSSTEPPATSSTWVCQRPRRPRAVRCYTEVELIGQDDRNKVHTCDTVNTYFQKLIERNLHKDGRMQIAKFITMFESKKIELNTAMSFFQTQAFRRKYNIIEDEFIVKMPQCTV